VIIVRRWWPLPALFAAGLVGEALFKSRYDVTGHAAGHLQSATALFPARAVVAIIFWATPGEERARTPRTRRSPAGLSARRLRRQPLLGAAVGELEHNRDELIGPFDLGKMSGAVDDDEFRVRERSLEPPCCLDGGAREAIIAAPYDQRPASWQRRTPVITEEELADNLELPWVRLSDECSDLAGCMRRVGEAALERCRAVGTAPEHHFEERAQRPPSQQLLHGGWNMRWWAAIDQYQPAATLRMT
jgi:hypothetical protein